MAWFMSIISNNLMTLFKSTYVQLINKFACSSITKKTDIISIPIFKGTAKLFSTLEMLILKNIFRLNEITRYILINKLTFLSEWEWNAKYDAIYGNKTYSLWIYFSVVIHWRASIIYLYFTYFSVTSLIHRDPSGFVATNGKK